MKLHKLISRTVIATALLGATFGGVFSGIKAHADENDTKGDSTQPDMSRKLKSDSSNNSDTTTTNTQVKDGFLTLDSVPTLSFGNSSDHNSNQANQPATFNLNSQNNGTLRITDYRNIDKNSYNNTDHNGQSGWQLSAKMSSFTNTDSSYKGNPLNTSNWTMHLNNNNNYQNLDVKNNNTEASNADFNTQSLDTNGGSSGNVLNSAKQNINDSGKGYGVNEINYNDSKSASLDIPNVPQGTYTANVTWSLSTPLTSYNTDSDNK